MKHIKKLFPFLKPYSKPAIASLVLLTAVVFMDLAIPRLVQRIIDDGIHAQNYTVVFQTAALMLVISITSTLFALGNNYLSILAGESVARDLREAMFVRIQSFSYGNLDQINTGQLMVRLSSDATIIQRLTQVFLRIGTRAPLIMAGSLILMYITNARLATVMLPILLISGILVVFFTIKMGPLFLTVQQQLDRLNGILQENIAGVRVVKAFVRDQREKERFGKANDDFAERNIHVMQFMSAMSPSLTLMVNFGLVTVIWFGGVQAINGDVTIGQLVAFVNYLQTILGPLGIMVMLSNIIAAATVSAERINEVLETVPEVTDHPQPVSLSELQNPRIQFEYVHFHYEGTNDGAVLEGINLTIEPGQTVAILGSTGSGKSTLINLIPRFYDATGGRVRINGMDVREVSQSSLLAQIGIVPQETILFSGTVRDNIRYGKPDASSDEVIAAAKASQAHEFILNLPDGYETHVNQRGVNLSGGQKQRIAIARSLLQHPAILILDDSTSSVDVETETNIHAAISAWTFPGSQVSDSPICKMTTVMVAQRISTVLNADKIIVIDNGRVAAEGTHNHLIQSSPIYQEIFASQLGGPESELRSLRREISGRPS
ncbi:MAG: ABC transporter ATP-binding protein/permease [Anaerolineae bacterium]|nr:ABC transporter ATP-binding protein/permease [Anaerolineae bacterium]